MSENENSAADKVRLYGRAHSPEAYALRDFFGRSVVDFDWIELTCDADCQQHLGLPALDNVRLPVVELADGTRLFAPSVREVAQRLGWVAQAQLKEYDVSIYGAGPAGLSAAVYAASEGLKTILVEREAVGGQAGYSSLIENYLGYPDGVSGAELAERARRQAVKFGVEILLMREGVKSEFKNNRIFTEMADGSQMTARANICATGVEWRRLNLPNEERFWGAGFYYGAGATEAPMCRSEHVVVVGGANSAGQAVMQFSRYAEKVTMLVRGADLSRGISDYLATRLVQTPNVEIVFDSQISALDGDETLQHIEVENTRASTRSTIETRRVFVCIGGAPNTEWAKDTPIIRDASGYLITGPDLLAEGRAPECWPLQREPFFLETSVPGSFAAGDVRHNSTKRVASAVGEGAMCVTFVHKYLGEIA